LLANGVTEHGTTLCHNHYVINVNTHNARQDADPISSGIAFHAPTGNKYRQSLRMTMKVSGERIDGTPGGDVTAPLSPVSYRIGATDRQQ
jgi:hypothetical protein